MVSIRYNEKKGFYCVSNAGEGRPLCLGPVKGRDYEPVQNEDREYLYFTTGHTIKNRWSYSKELVGLPLIG